MLKLKKAESPSLTEEENVSVSIPEEETPKGFKNGMKKIVKKVGTRNLTIVLAVLMIGGAVYLNFRLFGPDQKTAESVSKEEQSLRNTEDKGENKQEEEKKGTEKTSSEEGDEYFAEAMISRQKARDEAMEVLQLVIDNDEALDDAKSVAMAEMTQIATDIESESNIESLITAKGIKECVAVISGSSCSVIVRTGELLPSEIAQIKEIVYEQAGILPENLKIIHKQA